MTNNLTIKLSDLNEADFGAYGHIIAPKLDQAPDSSGENWQCWFPLGELQQDRQLLIGMVRSEPGDMRISEMEQHPKRSEWVFAIDKPVVQAVAFSGADTPTRPNPQTVKAFLINPGQGVLISEGIWHAAGLAPHRVSATYGFVLAKPSSADDEIEEGMVPFQDEVHIAIKP